MTQPKLVKKGDRIAIIAPARKVSQEDIAIALSVIEGWGLELVLGKHLFEDQHSYLAATDENRLQDFQSCLDDDSISAIVCARGGYGSTRIIDHLDFSIFKKNPKWIVGFSDITGVHLSMLKQNVKSIHATMPVLFSKKEAGVSIESLWSCLFAGESTLTAEANTNNRLGNANGIAVGGNLSLIVDSLGTRSEIDTNGAILIIEEIDEYFYKVDRMMTQLRRAGKLNNLKGLAIGHMTEIKESTLHFKETVGDIILNAVRGFHYPVAFGFPSGHENPNLAWINGGTADLRVDEAGANLSFKTSIA